MKLSLLTITDDTVSANIIKTNLESESIPCFLHNENLTSLLPNSSNQKRSGVQLMVSELLEKVIEIADLQSSEISCPDCGSEELVNITKQKWKNFRLFFLILSGITGNSSQKYSCSNCGYMFRK